MNRVSIKISTLHPGIISRLSAMIRRVTYSLGGKHPYSKKASLTWNEEEEIAL
jgi:hypothetical protein